MPRSRHFRNNMIHPFSNFRHLLSRLLPEVLETVSRKRRSSPSAVMLQSFIVVLMRRKEHVSRQEVFELRTRDGS